MLPGVYFRHINQGQIGLLPQTYVSDRPMWINKEIHLKICLLYDTRRRMHQTVHFEAQKLKKKLFTPFPGPQKSRYTPEYYCLIYCLYC